MRQWVKFAHLRTVDRHMLIGAAFLLLGIRWGFTLLGYVRIRRLLSVTSKPEFAATGSTEEVDRIAWAVGVAGRIVLGKKPCLAIALATHWLLSRRGLRTDLRIGMIRQTGSEGLNAHAWVEHNGRILIGETPVLDAYHRLPAFDPWA